MSHANEATRLFELLLGLLQIGLVGMVGAGGVVEPIVPPG
jgi:hypothetical protein